MSLTQTLYPNAESGYTSSYWTIAGGAASIHAALGDNSDPTYVKCSQNYQSLTLSYPAPTGLASGRVLTKVTVHVRARSDGGTVTSNFAISGKSLSNSVSTSNTSTANYDIDLTRSPSGTWTVGDLAGGFSLVVSGNTGFAGFTFVEVWVVLTYDPLPQVTLDNLSLQRDADMKHAIEFATVRLNTSGVLETVRWEIAADAAGSSLLADSGVVTTTAIEGQVLSYGLLWSPPASGVYYVRIGVTCVDHETTYWTTLVVQITLPTILSSSVQQQGEYIVATATVSNTSLVRGVLFYCGGDSVALELSGGVFRGTLWVERGDVSWTLTIATVWTTLAVQGILHVDYPVVPGIRVYQGDQQLDVKAVQLVERLVPDVPEASFTIASDAIDLTSPVVFRADGRQWKMAVMSAQANDDEGTYSVSCKDIGYRVLAQRITSSRLPSTTWGIAMQLGLQWAKDYTADLTALMTDTQFDDMQVSDILASMATLNGVRFGIRSGRISCYRQDTTPVMRLVKGKQLDCSQVINHVIEDYTVASYPSPVSYLTLLPSLWTGTVSAASAVPTSYLKPLSGASAWLKATGAISTTGLSALLSDYDHVHFWWSPVTAGSLTIRLAQDGSNYLEKTIPYAGSVATGWLATGPSSGSIANHTYSLKYRYHSVQLTFSDTVTVRIREVSGGTDVYVTPWQQVGTDPVSIPLDTSLSAVDSLVVECTNLHLLDTGVYGIRCTAATLNTLQMVPMTSSDGTRIVWQGYLTVDPTRPDANGNIIQGSLPPTGSGQTLHTIVLGHDAGGGTTDVAQMYAYITESCAYTSYMLQIVPVTIAEQTPLDQEVNLELAGFTKTGNPLTLATITLTATGDNYYDSVCLQNVKGLVKTVEAFASGWTPASDIPTHRKGDQWCNSSVAQAFANAYLALYQNPLVTYTEPLPLAAPAHLGDMVDTADGVLPVTQVTFDNDAGMKYVVAGIPSGDTLSWMSSVDTKLRNLERSL